MKNPAHGFGTQRRKHPGFTVAELMVAVAISAIVLAVIAALSLYGLKSFTAMGNYADMDGKSRAALDAISRDLRECTEFMSSDTNLPTPFMQLKNATAGIEMQITWDSVARTLTTAKTS